MIKHKIFYLLILIFFLGIQLNAQDFTITVDNITESWDFSWGTWGPFTEEGEINIDINDNFFLEGHTMHITAEGPCFVYNQQVYESQSFPIAADFGCAGKYCFNLIKNKDTDTECTIRTCLIVEYCRDYVLVNGRPRWLKEPKCDSPLKPDVTDDTFSKINNPQLGKISTLEVNRAESEIVINEVYPNPFSSNLKINMLSNKSGKITASLINALGKVILSRSLNVDEGLNLLELEIEEDMPFGSYFLIVSDELGHRHFHQVVHASNE